MLPRRLRLLPLLLIASATAACGGSSSETPPPLQPDPLGFRYASAPIVRAPQGDAGLDPDPEDDPKPAAPASGK